MIAWLLLAAAQPANSEPLAASCGYNLEEMLELDQSAFDQDLNGGWRPLGQREGCELAAAELIREWRHIKRNHASILYWHEGQLRAQGGQTQQAIALFGLTRKSVDNDADFGWNHYVDGTIAFLERDRDALARAIERLRAVPEPTSNSFTRPDGTIVQLSWPPNLNVLEGFERCWDKTYAEVYGNRDCSAPIVI